MTTYVGILPHDVLDALSLSLNDRVSSPRQTRFLTLPHPRTGVHSLFLPYEDSMKKTSVLEVQEVAPPNARSWFIGQNEVVADGKLLILTPIDPALLLIPILQSVSPQDGTSGNFRQLDDILEIAASKLTETNSSISAKDVLHLASLDCITRALRRVCDVKEITPEITVYRFSNAKLVEYLRVKVARLASSGAFECSRSLIRSLAKDGLMEDGKEDLLQLGRTRAACDLIGHYIPSEIRTLLLLSYDLKPLDEYLRSIKEADTPFSNEPAKKLPEKTVDNKRKLQAKSSHGVEKLKKVNVNGMAKLSSFFTKV